MKQQDPLRQFITLRTALRNEKQVIEARLAEINRALAEEPENERGARGNGGGRGGLKTAPERIKNPMSLKEAVVKVTSSEALSKKDILAGIQKLGYRFSTSDPSNSLNVVLYGKRPKFSNSNGKFSPAPGSDSARTPVPSGKRKVSRATRAKLAAATRARWAKVRQAQASK